VLEQQVFLHRHLLCIAEPLLGGGRRGADLDMVLAVKLSSFSSTAETTIRVPGLISWTFSAGFDFGIGRQHLVDGCSGRTPSMPKGRQSSGENCLTGAGFSAFGRGEVRGDLRTG
jgi:hypothetical protein